MNKETFISVLQASLFKYDEMPDSEIMLNLTNAGASRASVEAGIRLTKYLKEKKI